MKKHLLLILILAVSLSSCNKANEPDRSLTPEEYQELGMPDYNKVWSLEDYSIAFYVINTLKYGKPMALPSRDSKKSGQLFSRMINIENLAFLQDTSLPLHAKAEMIQWYGNILQEFTAAYTLVGTTKQLYAPELMDIDLFSLTIAQIMLDLGGKINNSSDPEDIAMQSDFSLIQKMYLDLLSDLFGKQLNESRYPEHTLELLSDSITSSVKRNMDWFDVDASALIKQEMLSVIDSTSSRKIKKDYSKLREIL